MDTVDHNILPQKLDHYGVKNNVLPWFKNYLSNRQQFTYIDGVNSITQQILTWVPQGSVLGPILFTVYINDLPSCTKFIFLLFADDTTFQISFNDLEELFQVDNSELQKAAGWFQTNKLTLNIFKQNI